MKIYTVIPFYFNGIEINENYVKSFKTFIEAENYAFSCIDNKPYTIVENQLL